MRWIPRTKASDAELWYFSLICVWINGWGNSRFETLSWPLWRHSNGIPIHFLHGFDLLCFICLWILSFLVGSCDPLTNIPHWLTWASYQIRKIAGCACAGNAGNVFPRRRFQRKLLVSDPGMHHGTCVTHVPWCMSGSLTCGDGENVPGIPGAFAPAISRIWQEAHRLTLTVAWISNHMPNKVCVGSKCSPIPKLRRLYRRRLGMDK